MHPLDRDNLEAVILRSPEQFQAGLETAKTSLPRDAVTKWGKIQRVLLAGMGGSWMAAALFRDAGLAKVRIAIHRGYDLPPVPKAGTLVIASSFSGNTEETLSAYDVAKKAGMPLIGVAAGGELEQRCAADSVQFMKIPADPPTMQPRYATGYGVGIFAGILSALDLTRAGAAQAVETLGPFLRAFMTTARERGEALIPALRGVTPVVYAADRFASVVRIWKIKINENAKTPAFWNVFPELNHNEMIGFSNPQGKFHAVYLRAPDDHPRVLARFEITDALLREKGVSGSMVPIEGQTLVEQIFSTLLVGDWASYGLALAYGIDPSPVPVVEELKRRLKD